MKYDPDVHHRRSIRLNGYDYSQDGAHFITVCAQNRECLFGEMVNGQMAMNDAGRMVQTVWDEIPENYHGIETDEFVVMPNHIHGIVIIVGAAPCGRPDAPCGRPVGPGQPRKDGQPRGVASTLSLPDVVHRFKTMTTKRYTDGVKKHGWPPYPGKLWQRNYYEHIIRNENELNRIREYIIINPMKWKLDRENPDLQMDGNGQPRGVAPTGTDEAWRI